MPPISSDVAMGLLTNGAEMLMMRWRAP
jgi:hypothetical protein